MLESERPLLFRYHALVEGPHLELLSPIAPPPLERNFVPRLHLGELLGRQDEGQSVVLVRSGSPAERELLVADDQHWQVASKERLFTGDGDLVGLAGVERPDTGDRVRPLLLRRGSAEGANNK